MRAVRRAALAATLITLLFSAAPASAAVHEELRLAAPAAPSADHAKIYHRWVSDLCTPQMQGRDIGTPGIDLARDYIVERFEGIGLLPAFDGSYLQELNIRVRTRPEATQPENKATTRPQASATSRLIPAQNVVGILPGRGSLAGEAIVIGAHYDHIGQSTRKDRDGNLVYFPGADDNASGTAGLMMLARWFAEREPTMAEQDRRTIIFAAFTGEERGLHGSAYLAANGPKAPPTVATTRPDGRFKVVAMLNMDMIGRLRSNRLYVQGVESGDRWREIVGDAVAGRTLDVRMSGGGYGPSDHASFYARGVPVLFFITGGHSDVHRPTDTPDKINAAGAIEVLGLVDAVARSLRVAPNNVGYVKTERRTTMPAAPAGAYLGVMLDHIEDGDGCMLADILPDGPAAKAGLKPEDVIVGFNGRKIADARALLAAVAGQKPGDLVKLQVRRAGKLLDIQVTLGQR